MVKKTNLTKKTKQEVLDYIKLIKKDKIPVEKAFIFGSQAKGKTHLWSDIDVCIISSKFKDYFQSLHYLLIKSYQIKSIIEPHPYHPKNFVNEDPLVWEIKKTGVRIV